MDRDIASLGGQVIETQHRRKKRPNDAGYGEAHHYRYDRHHQRNQTLYYQTRLLLMNIGSLERHRGELSRLLPELQYVNTARWEHAGLGKRTCQPGAALHGQRRGVDSPD